MTSIIQHSKVCRYRYEIEVSEGSMLLEVLKADDIVGLLLSNGTEIIATIVNTTSRVIYVQKVRKVEVTDIGIELTQPLVSCKGMAALALDSVSMYWKVDERVLVLYQDS